MKGLDCNFLKLPFNNPCYAKFSIIAGVVAPGLVVMIRNCFRPSVLRKTVSAVNYF